MDEQTTTPVPSPKPEQVIIHKNNAPLVSAIIFLALTIAGAAAYLGTQKSGDLTSTLVPTPTKAVQTPTVMPTQKEELNWESYVNEKMKDLSFPGYSLSYPFEWSQKETRDEITTTLTLTKGAYSIKIYQAPMGGSQCIFEGAMPEGPAQDFKTAAYIDILNGPITLRRVEQKSAKPNEMGFTFCSNSEASKTTYGSPTLFGAISYITPLNPDSKTLSEMDNVIKTLKSN